MTKWMLFGLLAWGSWVSLRADTITPIQADVYEKKKAECQAFDVPFDKLKLNAASYRGQVVEISGKITGLIVSPRAKTIIVEASAGGSVFVTNVQDDPLLANGNRVRVLGRVPSDAVTLTELEFIAIAPPAPERHEPIITETAIIQGKSSPSPPPSNRPSTLASRGAPPANEASSVRQQHSGSPAPPSPNASGHWLEQRIAALKPQYKQVIARFNPRLSDAQRDQFTEAILRFSAAYGVDARLIVAIIAVESSFDPNSTSSSGAMGLGQLMPGTASGMGVTNAYDPIQNIAATVKLIRGHLEKYKDKPDAFNLALAAYNAGSGAVRRYGGVPPFKETTRYLWKVYNLYKQLAPDMFQ
jgi:hypothetical protein